MDFKFKVGEIVKIVMMFAQPNEEFSWVKAQVTKRENHNGENRYKLKGYTGWWQEKTLQKVED